jgi:opacity protein-like surface antigen
MFKKLLVLLSMLAALAMSAVAFAAPAKSHQQMVIDVARAEVPAAAVFYGYREDDGEAVLNFRDNDNYLEYEVEVVLATAKVKEVEIKGSNIAGSTMMVKTPEDIRNIILEAYPDARNIVIETEKEGNNVHYDVEFITARYKVEADMNPVTGAFAKRELEYF